MNYVELIKKSVKEFVDDECSRMAAALSYFTVFSLPPLLLIILKIASFFPFETDRALNSIERQVATYTTPSVAEDVVLMIESAGNSFEGGTLSIILTSLVLLYGATKAFAQLQSALNKAWEVERNKETPMGVGKWLLKRGLSFLMIGVIAALFIALLIANSALTFLEEMIPVWIGMDIPDIVITISRLAITYGMVFPFIMFIYRVLPDARLHWKDVLVGSLITTVLFVIGQFATSLYIGNSDPGSAYGAAGSLAVLFIWIYYQSNVLFFGAELTQVWTQLHGNGIEPVDDAYKIEQ